MSGVRCVVGPRPFLLLLLAWSITCARTDAPPVGSEGVPPSASPTPVAPPNVTGTWETVLVSQAAGIGVVYTMAITQNGTTVSGSYQPTGPVGQSGIVQGMLNGPQLTGTWQEPGASSGVLAFTFAPDARSFSGTWSGAGMGGTWSGQRR